MTTDSVLPPLLANVAIGTLNGSPVLPSEYFIRWANVSLTARVGPTTSETLPSVSLDVENLQTEIDTTNNNLSSLTDEVEGLGAVPPAVPLAPPDDPDGRLQALEALVQSLAQEIEGLKQGIAL